ncbi:D-alanyl-D-alanine carboxypeptidase/D-alanyl-D-alanine-endopeptidase [Humibacter sp. BT305]|nr:D-alanyl-D-alanine carboxypeptidase/D-alanyl-D-alanine-endopeptidase [Humibacter sp. BT305]
MPAGDARPPVPFLGTSTLRAEVALSPGGVMRHAGGVEHTHRITRPAVLAAVLAGTALVAAGCTAPGSAPDESTTHTTRAMSAAIQSILDDPRYAEGRWGLSVVDLDSGQTLLEQNPHDEFQTGSTAKILSVTAALADLGPDHRIDTPVYALGDVSGGGVLDGDLVLQGAGDLTLGGRTKADGTIDIPIFDHYDANALPGVATLTPDDPVAGLDELARQVAASGITRVGGDVLVDDRLWDPVVLDEVPITPIVVNDNLLDLLVTPGAEGSPATATSRPQTSAYRVTVDVTTGAPDSPIDLDVTDDGQGSLTLSGSVPAGAEPIVHTYQVPDPATWARTLFIEALQRAGVEVDASATAANDADALPPTSALGATAPVAVLASPPFSETAKLINKVSHNLGANQLPLLLAAQAGQRTLDNGLSLQWVQMQKGGLTSADATVLDGQGLPGNVITPAGMTGYLDHLTTTETFDTFFDSTPILGVDGSLASVLPKGDPATGHGHAKTGTLVEPRPGGGYTLVTKALAGYIDAESGHRLAFAVFVNDVPMDSVQGVFQANSDLGAIASALYSTY